MGQGHGQPQLPQDGHQEVWGPCQPFFGSWTCPKWDGPPKGPVQGAMGAPSQCDVHGSTWMSESLNL